MSKKYGFFVTSAVNAKFSVYKPEERLQQTLDTIKSIKTRCPDAFICLTDCSVPGLDKKTIKKLTADVDRLVDFSTDETVQWIQKNIEHQDTVKNLTELLVAQGFFEMALAEDFYAGCDRVFKVSGRYTLTERFNTSDYENDIVGDKYVVSKRMLSQFPPGLTGTDMQHMLRVYSFGTNRIPEFIDILQKMTEYMRGRTDVGAYIDIEHLWHMFLPKEHTVLFDRTGVAGHIAPNGIHIEN